MELNENAVKYNPTSHEDEEDETSYTITEVDMDQWVTSERVPTRTTHGITNSVPSLKVTHMILSDDITLLEEKLDSSIPTGLIVVHGGVNATKIFCDAIHKGQPIFLFKYTGSTADLAVEMLAKVETFLRKKRVNPTTRPEPPFKTNLPINYTHPRWLWPFAHDHLEICRQLNILIENFPDRYNPASVLQIDMFHTSEERLQDQLTKTMSVVFEGVIELGGQTAESRRLTYAWRLKHLLAFNAFRQKLISDVLQALITLLSLGSTAAACLYVYYTTLGSTSQSTVDTLLKVNLMLPLAVTVSRGVFATLNPQAKAVVLESSAIRLEGEIYMYGIGSHHLCEKYFLI